MHFLGPLKFDDILHLEQLHIIHWLIYTPCQHMRERQILAVRDDKLERYLRLLDPQYVSLLLVALCPGTCLAILYRLRICGVARILIRLPTVVQEKILNMLDDFTRNSVRSVMDTLPREFYFG